MNMRFMLDMAKAGPFIGPKGGKWADAAHTRPYKEAKRKKTETKDTDAALGKKIAAAEDKKWSSPDDHKVEHVHAQLKAEASAIVKQRAKSGKFQHPDARKLMAVHDQVGGRNATVDKILTSTAILFERYRFGLTREPSIAKVQERLGAMAASTVLGREFGQEMNAEQQARYDAAGVARSALGKSERFILVKAGPFIGPRGGKWADAKHTIPWKERGGKQLGLFDQPVKPKAVPTKEDAEYATRVAAYDEKQEAKRERYEARADAAHRESERRFKAGDLREEASGIPMGQPILVGHHSEKRHRAALKRADRNMRAGIEASKKAEHYERKVKGVGTGGISSDDPAAVVKLKEKIDKAEQQRAEIKKVNRLIRKKGMTSEKLAAEMGYDPAKTKTLMEPDFSGRVGIPSYVLTNLGANIRRMRQRVDQLLEAAAVPEAAPVEGKGYRIEENKEDNRIRMFFDEKPSKEVRTKLKSAGFRWSPSEGAWQRHLNNAGRYAVERMRKEIFPTEAEYPSVEPDAPSKGPAVSTSTKAVDPDVVFDRFQRASEVYRYRPGEVVILSAQTLANAASITVDEAKVAAAHLVAAGKLEDGPAGGYRWRYQRPHAKSIRTPVPRTIPRRVGTKPTEQQLAHARRLLSRAVRSGEWHDTAMGQGVSPPSSQELSGWSQADVSALIDDLSSLYKSTTAFVILLRKAQGLPKHSFFVPRWL